MRRDDSLVTRAMQVVVVLGVGFLTGRALGPGAGPAAAAAVGLGALDVLLLLARSRKPDQAPNDRGAT